MGSKLDPAFAETLNICSKFFKEMQQICEKYKMTLSGTSGSKSYTSTSGGGNAAADGKKPKKKIYDPLKSDPNAPKKPIIQGYLMYYSDVRAQRQKEHPDTPNKDLTKIIADEWNTLAKDKKAFYDDKARKNREEYENTLEEYLKTNPAMREALSKKKKRKRSTGGTQAKAEITHSQVAKEVIDISGSDDDEEAETESNINGKRLHPSSSDESSEDSDDIDSSDGSPKKVKK